jgi:mannose/fructose/N-acetylgalactosamine-specific phosphotransferase system component IID
MKTKAYTLLGWMAWQGFTIIARRKLGANKVKLGAAATVLGVLVAGALAAKATGDDDS